VRGPGQEAKHNSCEAARAANKNKTKTSYTYFIGNICAKKYQNPFTCVKVIASQRWDVFETQCSFLLPNSGWWATSSST